MILLNLLSMLHKVPSFLTHIYYQGWQSESEIRQFFHKLSGIRICNFSGLLIIRIPIGGNTKINIKLQKKGWNTNPNPESMKESESAIHGICKRIRNPYPVYYTETYRFNQLQNSHLPPFLSG